MESIPPAMDVRSGANAINNEAHSDGSAMPAFFSRYHFFC